MYAHTKHTQAIAPLRILSIDIKCAATREGEFKEAGKDSVVQIANVVVVQGQTEPIVKNVLTLGK